MIPAKLALAREAPENNKRAGSASPAQASCECFSSSTPTTSIITGKHLVRSSAIFICFLMSSQIPRWRRPTSLRSG
jgi:hypothetical protein